MLDSYRPTESDLRKARELEYAEFCCENTGPPSDSEMEFITIVTEAFHIGPAPGKAATVGEARASLQASNKARLAHYRRFYPKSSILAYFEQNPDQL